MRRALLLATLLAAPLLSGCTSLSSDGALHLFVGNETPHPVDLLVVIDGVERFNGTLDASDSGGDFFEVWNGTLDAGRVELSASVIGDDRGAAERIPLEGDTYVIVAVSEARVRIQTQQGPPLFM